MIVKFQGQGDDMTLLYNKDYEVMSIESGWFRILDESGEDYLYPARVFEIVEEKPISKIIDPQPSLMVAV